MENGCGGLSPWLGWATFPKIPFSVCWQLGAPQRHSCGQLRAEVKQWPFCGSRTLSFILAHAAGGRQPPGLQGPHLPQILLQELWLLGQVSVSLAPRCTVPPAAGHLYRQRPRQRGLTWFLFILWAPACACSVYIQPLLLSNCLLLKTLKIHILVRIARFSK